MDQGFTFDEFRLDPGERRLLRRGEVVEVNARYFDALLLMVGEGGRLVSKDRFMAEVWRGVPVTDEALTQCIRSLRRLLGDDAADPRFIETVPKHGYRFIAPVERSAVPGGHATLTSAPLAEPSERAFDWSRFWQTGLAGTAGGGIAGLLGGLVYGFAAGAAGAGVGAASLLVVLVAVTVLVALAGGAGVSFGIAAAIHAPGRLWQWSMVGGALGGMIVGAVAKLLGMDAFALLIGQTPGDITGPAEGVLLGAAVGLSAWLADRGLRHSLAIAGALGGGAGALVALAGGRLMGGSLAALADSFPGSRLDIARLGGLFGEGGFGPVTTAVTGGLEGGLFSACVVGAMVAARKWWGQGPQTAVAA